MTLEEHAESSFKKHGIRAEVIHKWIDGYFDIEGFTHFLKGETSKEFDPYNHRRYRHCREALDEALREFSGTYSPKQIKEVFETHIRDDYDGYLPERADYDRETFLEKYHESRPLKEKILSDEELREYFLKNSSYKTKHQTLKDSGFRLGIVFPSLIALLLFGVTLFLIVIPLFRNRLMESKKEMLIELASTAQSITNYYEDKEKSGVLTLEEAQQKALSEIRKIRFGSDHKDYFWIMDSDAVMLMHPYRPELEGQSLMNYEDPESRGGLKIFAEFLSLTRESGEGFLEYHWQWKDDPERTALKLGYALTNREWNWIIGTGFYIHDVELELADLTQTLSLIMGIVTFLTAIFLTIVVFQGRRIELQRQKAEIGLQEAKERYRALVESSNEGTLLTMQGKTVFVNRTLQRMTGLRESSLLKMPLDEIFTLKDQDRGWGENEGIYTVFLLGKDPELHREMELTLSRLFFPHGEGILYSFRKISHHKPQDYTMVDGISETWGLPSIKALKECQSLPEMINSSTNTAEEIKNIMASGVSAKVVRNLIENFHRQIFIRSLELHFSKNPAPAGLYNFVSTGSSARKEMTLFSDQDNAVIYKSTKDQEGKQIKKSLLKAGKDLCSALDQTGFPFCPGGLMAMNPRWCMELNEWKNCFSDWINEPVSESLLLLNSFFDMVSVFGDKQLSEDLQQHIFTTVEKTPAFLPHFARNALLYSLPLSSRGRLKGETRNGRKVINLKECLKPLEIGIRLYCLQNKVTETGTLPRIQQLQKLGILDSRMAEDLSRALDILWDFRLRNQISRYSHLQRVDDDMELDELSFIDKELLTAVFISIERLMKKIQLEFTREF